MLQVNFIMIWIIHKILKLIKITIILKRFLRSVTDFYSLKNNYFFSKFNDKRRGKHEEAEEENIIKDVRNLFRLENEIYI